VIVVLAGGTGGAKLAAGMRDVVGAGELTVVANTGDDAEVYGAHVSPDPDLVTWWLADVIDERGWGIDGDTWNVMEALERAGRPTWFRLGDADLAMCLVRTQALASGVRLTEAHAEVVRGMGVESAVLPMADEPVRTRVRVGDGWHSLQEYMIELGSPPPEEVEFVGIETARPTPEVLGALADAELIVIGPSNPVISIGPILRLPGMREAIAAAPAPVVAVSPFVAGRSVKGPTEEFCRFAGFELGAAGAAAAYEGVIDGIVSDEERPAGDLPSLTIPTLMESAESRREVARATVDFGSGLSPRRR
jgi:LPPG:FO 2-phospho-L-lactate transferase